MNIFPKNGLGPIRLGMRMGCVRKIWGQPERIKCFIMSSKNPEKRSIDWFYDSGVQLSFSFEDGFLLGAITTSSVSSVLYGVVVVGCTKSELLAFFPEVEPDDEVGGCDIGMRLHDRNLFFWFSDGVVDGVTVFPEYDVNDISIFPEQSLLCTNIIGNFNQR